MIGHWTAINSVKANVRQFITKKKQNSVATTFTVVPRPDRLRPRNESESLQPMPRIGLRSVLGDLVADEPLFRDERDDEVSCDEEDMTVIGDKVAA